MITANYGATSPGRRRVEDSKRPWLRHFRSHSARQYEYVHSSIPLSLSKKKKNSPPVSVSNHKIPVKSLPIGNWRDAKATVTARDSCGIEAHDSCAILAKKKWQPTLTARVGCSGRRDRGIEQEGMEKWIPSMEAGIKDLNDPGDQATGDATARAAITASLRTITVTSGLSTRPDFAANLFSAYSSAGRPVLAAAELRARPPT